jgi:hypothetical protein
MLNRILAHDILQEVFAGIAGLEEITLGEARTPSRELKVRNRPTRCTR